MNNDSLQNLINLCSRAAGVDITSKRRDRDTYMYGRAVFYTIAKRLYPRITLKQLGKCTKRDHATVIFSLRKSKETYINDPIYLSMYNHVLNQIENVPQEYDLKHDKMLYQMPAHVASYVKELYQEIEDLKKENETIVNKINNNILWEYVNQIPKDDIQEFIQYRVIPFLKMKLITN